MKWFRKWQDRRTLKRLRSDFEDFYSRSSFCKQMTKEDAFRNFCALEAMGEVAVRDMLKRDAIHELTIH